MNLPLISQKTHYLTIWQFTIWLLLITYYLLLIFVVVINSDECSCEGEGLAVGSEDGRVDVAGRGQEDSDRYKGDAEDGCHGGDEELYFDIWLFHV